MANPRPICTYYDLGARPARSVTALNAVAQAHRRILRGDYNAASVWDGNKRIAEVYRAGKNINTITYGKLL